MLISSRYSFSRAWLAILQIGYSYATMSRGLGDQIPTYGYAAFGLTFTPYLVMACLNLAGSLLTPDYPTMYLVDSDIMVEARKRGGRFEGVVGVAKTDKSRATGNGRGRITARFRCRDRSRSRSGRPKASSAALSGPPIADEVELFSAGRERTFKIHRSSSAIHEPQLNIPAHHPLTLDPKATSRIHRFRWILPIVAVLLSSISVFVNWYFSLFKRGNSTFAQRVWTMAWLIIGICIGLTMSLLPPLAWHSSDGIRKFFLASQMVCGVGAIGGLVVVVQMLNEYGVCWSF